LRPPSKQRVHPPHPVPHLTMEASLGALPIQSGGHPGPLPQPRRPPAGVPAHGPRCRPSDWFLCPNTHTASLHNRTVAVFIQIPLRAPNMMIFPTFGSRHIADRTTSLFTTHQKPLHQQVDSRIGFVLPFEPGAMCDDTAVHPPGRRGGGTPVPHPHPQPPWAARLRVPTSFEVCLLGKEAKRQNTTILVAKMSNILTCLHFTSCHFQNYPTRTIVSFLSPDRSHF